MIFEGILIYSFYNPYSVGFKMVTALCAPGGFFSAIGTRVTLAVAPGEVPVYEAAVAVNHGIWHIQHVYIYICVYIYIYIYIVFRWHIL